MYETSRVFTINLQYIGNSIVYSISSVVASFYDFVIDFSICIFSGMLKTYYLLRSVY